jgi:hypothetical protein
MLSSETNAAALIATDKTNANTLFMTYPSQCVISGSSWNICGERSTRRIDGGGIRKGTSWRYAAGASGGAQWMHSWMHSLVDIHPFLAELPGWMDALLWTSTHFLLNCQATDRLRPHIDA